MQFIHGMANSGGESLRCQDYQGQGGNRGRLLLRRMSGLPRKISDMPKSIMTLDLSVTDKFAMDQ
jgi:hypothetical protein